MKISLPLALACLLGTAAGAQDYENCIWTDHSGRMAQSYELVGPAACEAFCTESEGCGGWYYIPHNFSPDSAPGECGLYGSVADSEAHDREFCGAIENEAS